MAREFLDDDMLTWEAYASPGPFGRPEHAHVVFHCVTDPGLRARFVELEVDVARGGELVAEATDTELVELFRKAANVP